MSESRRTKWHIDDEIHPVDVGIRHKHISAIGVRRANRNTKVIGDMFELCFRKPSPRKGDGHQLTQHHNTACMRHFPIPEEEEKKAKRADEEIQKGTRDVRTADNSVGIGQGGFTLEHVKQMLDKRYDLSGKVIAGYRIYSKRIHFI